MDPALERPKGWMRRPEHTPLERGYLRELWVQLHPAEMRPLFANSGLTMYELALSLRHAGVTLHAVSCWINGQAEGWRIPSDVARYLDSQAADTHYLPLLSEDQLALVDKPIPWEPDWHVRPPHPLDSMAADSDAARLAPLRPFTRTRESR